MTLGSLSGHSQGRFEPNSVSVCVYPCAHEVRDYLLVVSFPHVGLGIMTSGLVAGVFTDRLAAPQYY